jgi:CheY-like chemotaxis protein
MKRCKGLPTLNEKIHILIVEDDPQDQELVLHEFKDRTDCEPHVVFTGEEAIECLRHRKFQLVLLDLNLPAMCKDGVQVISEVRRLGIQIPIVTLSGADGGPMVEAAKQAGVITSIQKPLTQQKLNQLLEMLWP